MAYDPGALESALAAAVGDEPRLIAELRGAFLESAALHLNALRATDSRETWQEAAGRMKGLAAGFGAPRLMDAATHAVTGLPNPASLRRIERAVSALCS